MDPNDVDKELARLEAVMRSSCERPDGSLDGDARAAQKQASRDRDELLVASGRMTLAEVGRKNSRMWDGVDWSKVRIAAVGGVPYEDLG